MNPIKYFPLAVLWLYAALRAAGMSESKAKALAVCAAKVRQVEVREARKGREEKPKKEKGKKKPKRITQHAPISGDVVHVAGYDLELVRSGDRKNRGELTAERGSVTGTESDFDGIWASVESATGGHASELLSAIEVLNGGEAPHDRFFKSSRYVTTRNACSGGPWRVSPAAIISAAQDAIAAA